MVVTTLVLFELIALHIWSKRRPDAAPGECLVSYCCDLERRILAGTPHAAARETAPEALAGVRHVMVRAERAGLPLSDAVRAFGRELRRARRHGDECRRIGALYFGRAIMAFGGAALVRAWLTRDISDVTFDDGATVLAAMTLLAAGMVVVRTRTPLAWIWQGNLAELAVPWLQDRAGLRGITKSPWSDALEQVRRRELKSGVALPAEVAHVLVDWSDARWRDARDARRRLSDLLPLLELTTIGLPSALILLIPVLRAVSASPP